MIDGLKLTMSGLELKAKLDERIEAHQQTAAHFQRALLEPPPTPGLFVPEHQAEHAIDEARKQIEVLTLIRDHIIADEVYRLGEFDLRFADLLPEDDFFDCDCLPRPFETRQARLPEEAEDQDRVGRT